MTAPRLGIREAYRVLPMLDGQVQVQVLDGPVVLGTVLVRETGLRELASLLLAVADGLEGGA